MQNHPVLGTQLPPTMLMYFHVAEPCEPGTSQRCSGLQIAKQQLLLEGELKPFHTVVLRLPVSDETIIAPALDTVAQQMGSQVAIGSYPVSSPLTGLCMCANLRMLYKIYSVFKAYLCLFMSCS